MPFQSPFDDYNPWKPKKSTARRSKHTRIGRDIEIHYGATDILHEIVELNKHAQLVRRMAEVYSAAVYDQNDARYEPRTITRGYTQAFKEKQQDLLTKALSVLSDVSLITEGSTTDKLHNARHLWYLSESGD